MTYDFDPHGLLSRPGDGGTAVAERSEETQRETPEPKPQKRKSPKRSVLRVVVGLIFVLFSLGALGTGGYMLYDAFQPVEAPVPDKEFSADDPDTYEGTSIDQLIEQLAIDTRNNDTVYDHMDDPDMAIHGDQADRTGISHIDADFDGAGVWIPSLDIVSPMIATGHNGVELILPEPPTSTWYNQTAEIGSDAGNSMIASHVNWGHGDAAPFSQLHKIDKGAPVFVRDFEGNDVPYVVTDIQVYDQQALPDELFTLQGDHQLVLLTCSGPTIERGNERYFLYNLVVTAEPYNPGIGA